MEYEQTHFETMCGAKMATKPETNAKTKKRKLSLTWKLMRWLVDEIGETEIQPLINKIDALGRNSTGYFALYPKSSSRKELCPLKEFLQYLALNQKISLESQKKAELKLENLAWNLGHRAGPQRAQKVADEAEMLVTKKGRRKTKFWRMSPLSGKGG